MVFPDPLLPRTWYISRCIPWCLLSRLRTRRFVHHRIESPIRGSSFSEMFSSRECPLSCLDLPGPQWLRTCQSLWLLPWGRLEQRQLPWNHHRWMLLGVFSSTLVGFNMSLLNGSKMFFPSEIGTSSTYKAPWRSSWPLRSVHQVILGLLWYWWLPALGTWSDCSVRDSHSAGGSVLLGFHFVFFWLDIGGRTTDVHLLDSIGPWDDGRSLRGDRCTATSILTNFWKWPA